MFLENELKKRHLPPLEFDRKKALNILEQNIYGVTPPAPDSVRGVVKSVEKCSAGKAERREIDISFDTPGGEFTFPVSLIVPKNVHNPWVFILLNFRPDIPDRYYPVEELGDNGFAVARIYFQDVSADSADFDKLAAAYGTTDMEGRADDAWGKIGMWAFAASRLLDYLLDTGEFDESHIAVIGHSRLGKTALWCGAQDTRFNLVCSNNAGCSGDAITRYKEGEHVVDIVRSFPYWFCKNYKAYADNEENMPFDQHLLLSLVAPRLLCISAAENDKWADPISQFLSCVAASEAYEKQGVKGLVTPDRYPIPKERLFEGNIGFNYRPGDHFLSRDDWYAYISFWNMHP